MWCYRQKDTAYAQLRVGPYPFSEGGAAVCAVADIVDVKPGDVLAFLQDAGYVSPETGVAAEGIPAALEHFGGSCAPAGPADLCDAVGPEPAGFHGDTSSELADQGTRAPSESSDSRVFISPEPASISAAAGPGALEALRAHLVGGRPAVLFLGDVDGGSAVVAAAGFDADRDEVLLFDPQGADRDGWYPWLWAAGATTAFALAVVPEADPYAPRYIFKQIYGVDVAGHEQRWPEIDLVALREVNPGCLGWIHLGGTPISYPIVKDRLDSGYYQTHNFSGELSVHGAVSLSFPNGGSFDAPNLVFSAHRMKDYSMFKMLTFYDRPDFSEEKPFIDLLLGTQLYRARVFSAYHYPKRKDVATRVDFADGADFERWVRERIALSMHPFSAPPRIDQVATFRTCYGLENDETFILHAALERA